MQSCFVVFLNAIKKNVNYLRLLYINVTFNSAILWVSKVSSSDIGDFQILQSPDWSVFVPYLEYIMYFVDIMLLLYNNMLFEILKIVKI